MTTQPPMSSGLAQTGAACTSPNIPAPLYHPALAGTPPEEGNWNHLGGLFQAPLYHGSVFGELSRTAELAERPASL